jgi:hypothetical protein
VVILLDFDQISREQNIEKTGKNEKKKCPDDGKKNKILNS